MRRLFDFKCNEGHITESLQPVDKTEIMCSKCNAVAKRIISPVRSKLEGISGAFPTAYDKWGQVHEQATKLARKRRLEHEGPDA